MGMTWDSFTLWTPCHFIFICVDCRTRLSPLKLILHTRLYLLTTRVLYATILIATHIQIYTRVSLKATHMSYVGCLYQYSRTHPFDIKKYKTWLRHISWALIINHLNCLNLLNLRNCFISQSINRGLGEGIRRMNLGEKSYAGGISSEVFGVVEIRVLWLQRSPCLRRWVVHLSHSLLLIKRILLPTLCRVSFMYHGW